MAVLLNFSVCSSSDCTELTFIETTGAYSSANATGWGSPNELTSDATAATLAITTPAATTTTLNIISLFPQSVSNIEYIITLASVGYTAVTAFPNGIYTFVYTVTTSTTTYTQTKRILIYCQAACCVWGMFAEIADSDCDCETSKIDDALEAWAYYKALVYAASCGPETKFTNLLTILDDICNNEHCDSCD